MRPSRRQSGLSRHAVKPVSEAGLCGTKDGPLLPRAEQSFDIFITIDRKLQQQLNLSKFKLGFISARVPANGIRSYQPIFAKLLEAAGSIKAGQTLHVVHPLLRDARWPSSPHPGFSVPQTSQSHQIANKVRYRFNYH